jgi:hypothetical protein
MKEKIKGKIFVGMIISLLAFGLATGTGIIIGTNPLNSTGIINLTQQSQFPSLPFSPSNVTSNNQEAVNTTNTPQQTINTPTNTQQTTNTPKSNSSNGNQNSNKSSPSKTNTSNT